MGASASREEEDEDGEERSERRTNSELKEKVVRGGERRRERREEERNLKATEIVRLTNNLDPTSRVLAAIAIILIPVALTTLPTC